MGMTLIETIEVGSGGAASIEFTGIDQTGTDLLCLMSLRDSAGLYSQNNVQLNSYTGSYPYVVLQGEAGSVNSYASTATDSISPLYTNNSGYTANTFTNTKVYVSNYTSSNAKSVSSDVVTENNGSSSYAQIGAHTYTQTAAVTSLKINANGGGSLVQYSSASLYIITAD
tara:strand:+ start:1042 stop:1551 length:510 start_codon:yes stop_codon:yes gene_type:complete